MVVQLDALSTPNPYAAGYPGQHKIAVRSTDGRIFATWDSDNGAVLAYSDDHGDTWSIPEPLSGTGAAKEASLWADQTGKIYIAYQDTDTLRYLDFREISPGGTMSEPYHAGTSSSMINRRPSVCSTPDGTVVAITWEYTGVGLDSPNIRACVRNGSTWDVAPRTITNSSTPQRRPSVFLYDDTLALAWCGPASPPETRNAMFLRQYNRSTKEFGDNTEILYFTSVGDVVKLNETYLLWAYIEDGDLRVAYMTPAGWNRGVKYFGNFPSLVSIVADGPEHVYYVYVDLGSLYARGWTRSVSGSSPIDPVVKSLDTTPTSILSLSTAPYHPFALYYVGDNDTIRFVDFGKPTLSLGLWSGSIILTFGDE